MDSEVMKNAVDYALQQSEEVLGINIKVYENGRINPGMLVDYVGRYLRKENYDFDMVKYTEIEDLAHERADLL